MSTIPTDFKQLDHRLGGGLHRGDLAIVASEPSQGKSAFAQSIAVNVARGERNVCLLSLESSPSDLSYRIIGALARIDTLALRRGQLSSEEVVRLGDAAESPTFRRLFIPPDQPRTPDQVIARIEATLEAAGHLSLVVLDPLQMLSQPRDVGDSDHSDFADIDDEADAHAEGLEIARRLKVCARELDLPLLAVTQVAMRGSRYDNHLTLRDLPYAGALEEIADVIIFLHEDLAFHEAASSIITLAKNRWGMTDSFGVSFLRRYAKFADLAA
jgi:replicative DNA helicase